METKPKNRRKRALWILGGAAATVIAALVGVYWAAQHEPAFYDAAMTVDPAALEKGSDRTLQQTAAIQGSTTRAGAWQVRFTATDLNGWFAVDLAKNHPHLLPDAIKNPRVAIDSNGFTLACRFEQNGFACILSLTLQPSMAKPNVLALRIKKARVGLLPAPLDPVMQRIAKLARELQCQVQWERTGGDVVALLTLPDATNGAYRTTLENVELVDGEICIEGNTEERK
jgi:hypothetical protein